MLKKSLSLLLTLALLVCALALPAAAEETPELTLLMQGGAIPPEETDVLTEIGRRIGAKLKVIYVSQADYAAKLNTLIAGKSLPDIYAVTSENTLRELYDAGKLYNFASLLPEYGPDILAYYGDNLNKPVLNDENGVYMLVSDAGGYLKNLSVRKDWLAKLNLDVPTDLDSLYNALYAFTYNDPDGNGVKDTYGIAGTMADDTSWQHVLAAYGIPCRFSNGAIALEDGTVTTFMKHPKFLDAMRYLNKLYQDGVMDPDFATITRMQCNERLWQGKVGVYAFQSVGTTNNWYPGRYTYELPENPADQFAFIHLNNAGATMVYPSYTKADAVINADCKHPELAVKLLNYLYFTEEGQELSYMGIEGVHYRWIDKEAGKYERLGVFTDDTLHRAAGAFVYNTSGGFTADNAETRLMNAVTRQAQIDERAVATPYITFDTSLESFSEYGATMTSIVKECFAQLIVTTGDIEAEYRDFIEQWEQEGGLEYEKEATALYASGLAR